MSRRIIATLFAATMLAAPAAARDGNIYVAGEGGFFFPTEIEFDIDDASGTDEIEVDHNNGYDVAGRIGYDFGLFRAEIEGSRKVAQIFRTDLDGVPGGIPGIADPVTNPGLVGTTLLTDGAFTTSGGATRIWTAMANLLLDIGGEDGVGFSVGGGAGIAFLEADIYQTFEPGPAYLDDDTEEFAFQALAELRYPLADLIDVGVKYRYFNVPDYQQTTVNGLGLDADFDSHSLLASLTFNFGGREEAPPPPPPPPAPPAPAPAPPPPPPPPPVQEFIVFFDFDESAISTAAEDTLRQAAEAYRDGGNTSVTLAGHADASGPADYNVGLSQRRADAVRGVLVSMGVPESVIAMEAFGESRLLVETADGVREPQNRRVEINLDGAAS
ncbi:MAG: OmpA family protein [Pseudomonadota bacterium]